MWQNGVVSETQHTQINIMTITIQPKEIPAALSFDSHVIAVRRDRYGRERKSLLTDASSSETCQAFYTESRGFIRIDCEPSEAYLAFRNILATA